MSSDRIEREFRAFEEALEQPHEERAAFVRERYADDSGFADRVLRLLDAQERAEHGDTRPSPFSTGGATAALDLTPEMIGP